MLSVESLTDDLVKELQASQLTHMISMFRETQKRVAHNPCALVCPFCARSLLAERALLWLGVAADLSSEGPSALWFSCLGTAGRDTRLCRSASAPTRRAAAWTVPSPFRSVPPSPS